MTTKPFHRPGRRPGPAGPRGDLLLESPPDLPEATSGNFGQLLIYLPMLAGAGAMVFMFAGTGGSPLTYLTGGLYGMSSVGMMLGMAGRGFGDKKRKLDGERRDYLRYVGQARRRIRAAARGQREAAVWDHPDPDALWSIAMTSRLWERRPNDADFCAVRLAVGPQRLALRLVAPDTKPVEDLEPVSAVALRALVRAHAEVPDLPIRVDLRSYARLAWRGDDPEAVRDNVRALLCQLVTFHGPDELRIAVCASRMRMAQWSWVKWLPHAWHPSRSDGAGPYRLVSEDLGELEELLGGELADRPRFKPGVPPHPEMPQLVVLLDGGRVPLQAQLAIGDAQGVVLLDLSGSSSRDHDRHLLRLQASALEISILERDGQGADQPRRLGRPDRLGIPQAEALARVMTPHRIGAGTALPEPLDAMTDLPSLLGIRDLDLFDPEELWQHRAPRDRLRLPIGLGADGSVVELDVKESAAGGVGPHGLIIGATGAGKSELLRTLVLGWALTHSSETLNFVLVDFKGGATFLGLEELSHTSALITNLSDELPLVDRMQDALRGELVRRQELLRSAGNFTSVHHYEQARTAGSPLAPLPTLLVVVDEFSELLATKPEFAELFVMIGRLGRSLAVHLLLASQRLEEGRLRGLESHLSYRICLRTFSAMESRTVLGVADAYELPGDPGHGYVKSDVNTLMRFKAAYVSGTHRPASATADAPSVLQHQVVPFGTGYVPLPVPADSAEPTESETTSSAEGPDDPGRAVRTFDVLVDRLRGRGTPAHRVWLPPLSEPVTLGELLGAIVEDPTDSLVALESPLRGTLSAPVGVEDRPFEQRRDALTVDLSAAGGHIAVVGAPQSGKSTLLRTLICSLALTHTPEDVQFYCIDFGGGALGSIEALPHVGGVAPRMRPEAVRRTVAEVSSVLDSREAAFALHGIDSMAAYRRARRDPDMTGLDDGYGDVFLVIDGWGQLRQEYDTLEAAVTSIAARGLAYGVHVVVAANRWAEIRQNLKDVLGTRLELRLGDAYESEVSRQLATDVPESMPGRGISKDRLHFLAAVPRIDGVTDASDLADGLRELVQAARAAWPGAGAPPVRLLPQTLSAQEFAAAVPADSAGVALGLGEDDLSPAYVDFDADAHFVVYGSSGSGKSSVLRGLCDSLVRRHGPDKARIVVVDYRRSLLEAVGEPHLIAYAGSPTVATSTIRDLAQVLEGRLPGPDVSPAQLRDRSWWAGADLFIVVDDYDLVGTSGSNPMQPLAELLPHSRDIGLHVLVARSSGSAGRSAGDQFARQLRELATPGLLLSGSREDGALIGSVSPVAQPAGRGLLVRRNMPNLLVQTPWRPPAS